MIETALVVVLALALIAGWTVLIVRVGAVGTWRVIRSCTEDVITIVTRGREGLAQDRRAERERYIAKTERELGMRRS